MSALLTELKRRNVFKVAVAYGVVAWLLIQVVATIESPLGLPEWFDTIIIVTLLIGFPVALILAWAFELTPDGVKPTSSVDMGESTTHVTGQKLNTIIIAVLSLAVVFLVIDNYVLVEKDSNGTDPAETGISTVVETEAAEVLLPVSAVDVEAETDRLPNSIAVLPFDNLSPNPDDAYFAAGIHEEVLNKLANLRNLSVISRTSMLRYADSDLSLPEIARELNVETVMEGSVRYAGEQVRITAQLIDAVTDKHLWSDAYDRDFKDIFAIQSDIAMNIANAIGAEFSIEEQARIERVPTESTDAYLNYLASTRGVALGGAPRIRTIRSGLENANLSIEADPEFADAYVQRAGFNRLLLRFDRLQENFETRRRELETQVLADLEKAIELDPNLGRAYTGFALFYSYNWRGPEALEAFRQAYKLSPNDSVVLNGYAYFNSYLGNHDFALELSKRAVMLNPNNFGRALAEIYDFAKDREQARAAYSNTIKFSTNIALAHTQLAIVEIILGNYEAAEASLRAADGLPGVTVVNTPQRIYGYQRLDLQADVDRLVSEFDDFASTNTIPAASRILVSLATGDNETALRLLQEAGENKIPYDAPILLMRIKLNVFDDPVLEHPEFVAARAKLGFTDL